ncbi:MAG: PIN domain-containing protein [Pseudomonadales bacterium]|nr:PIN domain-containing protein [Candidatus Woesebacteria bacterium]MCB9801480.1 PIN domain-containing protein [Pseudomonadales bacterium]
MTGSSVVVDTSIYIDFLRTYSNNSIYAKLLQNGASFIISSITTLELYAGKSAQNPAIQKDISQLLQSARLLPLSHARAVDAGLLRSRCGLDVPNAVIASLALELKIPLATLNTKHFQDVPGLQLFDHTLLPERAVE